MSYNYDPVIHNTVFMITQNEELDKKMENTYHFIFLICTDFESKLFF